jgi:hypothetical protein
MRDAFHFHLNCNNFFKLTFNFNFFNLSFQSPCNWLNSMILNLNVINQCKFKNNIMQ